MKKVFSLLMCILLLTVMFNALSLTQFVRANSGTIVVPDNCPTIQGAINNASAGDIIFVRANTYYEHVIVNKTLTLTGEDKNIFNAILSGKEENGQKVLNLLKKFF